MKKKQIFSVFSVNLLLFSQICRTFVCLTMRLIKSNIIRDSMKLISANVLAQAIGLLVYPLLTRLYSPEDFGLFNLFLSIGGVLVIIGLGDYFNAIVLPRERQTAAEVVYASVGILAVVTFISGLGCCFSARIAALFSAPRLADYWWLMPLYVLFSGLWFVLNYWYIREKRFTAISAYQVNNSLTNAGMKAGFGYCSLWGGGLIFSSILSSLFALVTSLWLHGRSLLAALLHVRRDQVRETMKQYRKFPLFSMPRSLLNNLSGNMPVLLLSSAFSLSEIGFFSVALSLAFRPINMVSSSFYQPFYQQVSENVRQQKPVLPFLRRYWLCSVGVLVPLFAMLYVVLPWLTGWLLGADYVQTGRIIRYLLPWLLVVMVVNTTNFLPDVFGKQRTMLVFECVYFVGRLAALLTGVFMHRFLWAVGWYSAVSVLVLLMEWVWFYRLSKHYDQSL